MTASSPVESQFLNVAVKSSFLDRQRRLTVNNEYIEFDDNDAASDKPTRFNASDIEAFRYGIKWIRGYQFVIGRIYCIDIKSKEEQVIKIRLKSLYGVNRKKLSAKYVDIVNALYNYVFDDVAMNYLQKFANGNEFEILGVTFKKLGVWINDKKIFIEWQDLGTKSYSTYYALFSKSNPSFHTTFEYLSEWNAGVLYSVSRQILMDKGFYSK